ncbi:hypothetical protein PsorP6_011430 [Peronosclerospora sorghi]|uniref:Uncharacterized protein n=1 Tax=Peronosclerospora sorghi TaxID=230839 RepID=A0ACC0WMD9_9STRA|nr:hypothetical protein PsorP6_011430 [Peronosclerospora sorghi]
MFRETEDFYRQSFSQRTPHSFLDEVNDVARDLVRGPLRRDPNERVASKSAHDVKHHADFRAIKWQEWYDRKIPPPFTPCARVTGPRPFMALQGFTDNTPNDVCMQKSSVGRSFGENKQTTHTTHMLVTRFPSCLATIRILLVHRNVDGSRCDGRGGYGSWRGTKESESRACAYYRIVRATVQASCPCPRDPRVDRT